ncbi:protein draper-like [Saccostrea cucullata]|uniref:protein draper-like n=1 Tax=Saccostrea cuccullata TaxID=36930 RepID=UPI002ED5DCEC
MIGVDGSTNGFTTRFLGFQVYISNTTDRLKGHLCFHDTNYTISTIPAVVNITCPVHGQYVIYHNERRPGVTYPDDYSKYAYIELCEVEVYGCPDPTHYGSDCSYKCSTNCLQYCDIVSGKCPSCAPGYKGKWCEQVCDDGLFGDGCSLVCGHCKQLAECHPVDGTCLNGCSLGYQGPYCNKKCDRGFYGGNCSMPCGHCISPAWKDPLEEIVLRRVAVHAMVRRVTEQMVNVTMDVIRVGGEIIATKPAVKDILEKNVSTSVTIHVKDVTMLMASVSMDVILDGKETFVMKGGSECDYNQYGTACNKTCGNYINSETCHHINGFCVNGCDSGYQGNKCDQVCEFGFYGINCRDVCSTFCKVSRDCHHVTGVCKFGCKAGMTGLDCLRVEDNDMYQARFYGILVLFCVTMVFIGLFLSYKIRNWIKESQERNNKTHHHQKDDVTLHKIDDFAVENIYDN